MDKNRIFVTYLIKTQKECIYKVAEDICYEQTVEVVKELAEDEWIRENIVGKIEEVVEVSGGTSKVRISFSDQITGYQIPQLLTLLYGNISLKTSIKILKVELSERFVSFFSGPRFGIEAIRKILKVNGRPLLATALKPMGKDPSSLANLSYQLALGGIDIIKDDHGLVDHPFCPYRERVRSCVNAIREAEAKTGKRVLYFPNITDSYEKMKDNISWAKKCGADGILISPMVVGLDFVGYLVRSKIDLPIMVHPALMGSFFYRDQGISHRVLLGDLMRLIGADLVIYPNFGGRFPFKEDDCRQISHALKCDMYGFKKSFPVPAGGINMEVLPKLRDFYGEDVVFLIGSNLYTYSKSLSDSVKYFFERLEG